MSFKEIQQIERALKNGNGSIKHYYSPHGLRRSQKLSLRSKGIKVEQRHRSYRWFELDFSI